MWHIDEVEAALDPFDTCFKPIDPPLNADHAFFKARHADLQILNVIPQTIHLLVNSPQVDQNQIVGLFGHLAHSAAMSLTGSPCGLAA